jgi:hypothetical protein
LSQPAQTTHTATPNNKQNNKPPTKQKKTDKINHTASPPENVKCEKTS